MMYPWHENVAKQLIDLHHANKLPHALLFKGPAWTGKFHLACELGQQLLCALCTHCNQCKHCHLLKANTHPAFRIIEPEASQQIRIEQIRDLIEWANQTPQIGRMKFAIIHPADQLNTQAANALLKCLEEPAPDTVILLVSSKSALLPATIRSRCRSYTLPLPDHQIALHWLQTQLPEHTDLDSLLRIAGGAPLAVINKLNAGYYQRRQGVVKCWLELLSGKLKPLDAARQIEKFDLAEVLEICLGLFTDAVKVRLSGEIRFITNIDVARQVQEIAGLLTVKTLLAIVSRINQDYQFTTHQSNLNKTLLLEGLILACVNCELSAAAEFNL